MSAYMSAVLACAAVTALANILVPDDGATSKYIKYISGLVTLSVIVMPILSALRYPVSFPELPGGAIDGAETHGYDYREIVIAETERTLSETVKNDLMRHLSIAEKDIAVNVTLDRENYGDIRIKFVTVTLTGYGAWTDTEEITLYIKENYDKKAEVEIRYE